MPVTIPSASIAFPKLHLPLFDDGRFTATQFDSSADKAKFANRLLRFIGEGLPDPMFNQSFYNRLSMCFSHIAHYDRHGFWGNFFPSTVGRIDFLDQTLRGGGYGDPAWTYCDVELAIRRRVGDADAIHAYRRARASEIENAERDLLRRLKAKHEPEPTSTSASPIRPAVVELRPAVQLGLF